MAVSTQPQLLSGARGVISVKYAKDDGSRVDLTLALALDISVNVRESVRETYVMGALNPVTLDPVAIDVDCSVGRVVPVNRRNAAEPGANGAPIAGDAAGTTASPKNAVTGENGLSSAASAIQLGLEETINRILTHDTVEIQIKDKITGKIIAVVKEARFAGRTLSTSTGDVANERINFVGIYDGGYENESTVTTGYDF